MRRSPFVLLGTIAGAAGVLAFPTHRAAVTVAPASASSANDAASAAASKEGASSGSSSAASTVPTSTTIATRSATGTDEVFQYGDVAVTVTVEDHKITKVVTSTLNENDGRSANIDAYALPQLEQQVIDADSASVSGVSGATFTSQAFLASVTSALDKLGFSG